MKNKDLYGKRKANHVVKWRFVNTIFELVKNGSMAKKNNNKNQKREVYSFKLFVKIIIIQNKKIVAN